LKKKKDAHAACALDVILSYLTMPPKRVTEKVFDNLPKTQEYFGVQFFCLNTTCMNSDYD
jgi:hypothetical protein